MHAHATQVTGAGPIFTFIGGVSDASNSTGDTYACVAQDNWSASVYGDGTLIFKRESSGYSACSNPTSPSCSCTAQTTQLPSSFYGEASKGPDGSAFSTIVIEDTLQVRFVGFVTLGIV